MKALDISDNDFIVGVSGFRGSGKSTLMAQFMKELKGGWYDFNEFHIYMRTELDDKLANYPDASVFGVDEAINNLFKREWHDNSQIDVVKKFNMFRDKRHKMFLLIPHFWDLDTAVRNSLIIKWWVYVYKLGNAVVFQPHNNPFSLDPWNMKLNIILWRRGKIFQSPNYLFNLTWKPLPEDVYQEYKKVKAIKRVKAKKESEILDSKSVEGLSNAQQVAVTRKLHPDWTGYKIAKELGIARNHVYEMLNKEKSG
jgi:ABC-type dipeptide/oligopeptide/nickel transport system ATPase component